MSTTAQKIIDRVSTNLNDIGNVRWTVAELLDAINDSEAALLEARPDLFHTTADFLLSPGNLQTAPADCYKFNEVVFNIDADGNQGKAVTFIKKSVLDRQRRAWTTTDDEDTEVRHWTQDEREWRQFYVAPYQPASTSQKVKIRYAKYPTEITAVGDNLNAPDEARNAVYYFCMMRMLEKDEKFAGSPQAARFTELFALFIGARTEADEQAQAKRRVNEGR